MANITISVQSFLNSATKLSITIADSATVAALKTAVNSAEGTPTAIMTFYYDNSRLTDTDTLSGKGIITGSYIESSNNLTEANLWTKEQRQVYKLELAQLRRQAGGDTAALYYRENNVYDRDLLPAKYVNNDPADANNTLQEHRPWTT